MDLYPTLAKLGGAMVPTDRIVDGKDFWPTLSGEKATHERDSYFYYRLGHLQAVRSGDWKIKYNNKRGTQLFNLKKDVAESKDLSAEYPEMVTKLESMAEVCRKDMGDMTKGVTGENVKPVGMVEMDIEAMRKAYNDQQQQKKNATK
jgi:arylsulfatase A-like enzyme